MPSHMFDVGQLVQLHLGGFKPLPDVYSVTAHVPPDKKGSPRYRVRGAHELEERVVFENELSNAVRLNGTGADQ